MNKVETSLGRHWLWFAPFTVVILWTVEWPILKADYVAIKLFTHRWVWEVVFSPAALVFLNVVWAGAVFPILGLVAVAAVSLSQQKTWERWLYSVQRGRYGALLTELERSGESQISLTDPDSRAMAAHTKVAVGYNIQVAVDAKNKMIVDLLARRSRGLG